LGLTVNFLCFFGIIIEPLGKGAAKTAEDPSKIGSLHSKYAGVYLIARKGDFVLIFARKNKERRCIDANVQSIG
jgi:hypothetical protein